MNADAKQASLVIESVARAVANWTVDQHLVEYPPLAQRYGASWRADWIGHTQSHLSLLAQATSVRSPELFAQSVLWTHQSFTARGVDGADLKRNIACLRQVLVKDLPPAVAQLALPCIDRALQSMEQASVDVESRAPTVTEHEESMLRYLAAILEGNRAGAEQIIRDVRERGVAIPVIYEQILAPAQARLGWMWHRGEISVADEHIGSATTQTVMSQLRLHFRRAAPNGRSVVGTATAGDLHEIGLRMVTDLFEMDGWDVAYLGANTPAIDVIELLTRRPTHLLALSVSTALTLRDAGELIDTIRAASTIAKTRILVGGPPFKLVGDLWRELGADGYALSATEAVKVGNQLVGG